ncbi:hypothetical protein LCGC14_1968580 [marine sediment metagenome]|uniref:Uncharacterized protein n=1 Tax=marine sediment metagenome TaxID=412755 RepID=A0A0F9FCT0_9ZZZZ
MSNANTELEKAFTNIRECHGKLLKEAVKAAEQALIDDASDLWRVTNNIKKEIESRQWITEGRGPYEWDDERYQEETKVAFDAVLKLIEGVQHPAQLRFHEVLKAAR